MKLLAYCDDPSGATGYSRQARNILSRFHHHGFQIACIGINKVDESPLYPWRDDRMPFKVYRANIKGELHDQEGRGLITQIFDKLGPDILFVMGDIWFFRDWFASWLERKQFIRPFKTIGYYSCEYPINDQDIEILSLTDYPICHSKWGMGFENEAGYDEIKKRFPRLIYIPDTVDSKAFNWISEEQRAVDRASFSVNPDHFLIGNVNRNSSRKDIASTISAFKRVKKEIPNARLYLHTSSLDEFISGERIDLIQKCKLEGLTAGYNFDSDVCFPKNFTAHYGYPDDLLCRIYNCCDLLLSTSLSEGFGVTPLEALFCGRPILIPGHTGFSSLCETLDIKPVRYYPIKDERVAPCKVYKTDEDDLVNRIVEVYQNRDKTAFRSETLQRSVKAVEYFDADRVFASSWIPIIADLKNPKAKKKAVLYIQRGSAGDVFLSTSVFSGLRARHPGLPLHYMTKPEYRNIIELLVDEIIEWQPSMSHEYEWIYMPHEFKIWPGNWGCGDTPLTRIYSEILGVPFDRPRIVLDPVDSLPEEYVVVHGTAGHAYRDYYNFHVALENCRLPVIQIGARNDKILGNGDFELIDKRGQLTFRQSAYVVSKAKMFIGVDSFPMHIAGAYDIPMVVTFGCGAARVTGALTNGPVRFLEPVYSKVCPIVGPCFGNYPSCPNPCGPRHSPQIVREAIRSLISDIFNENKRKITDVNKRLMALLDKKSDKTGVEK